MKFRLYSSNDLIGTQLGGALKNVIAIASGISDGMRLGLNARAALICRGVAEMTRLGIKMGGLPSTFSGLSGVGDLILTATSNLSRNYLFGKRIGEGYTIDECLNNNHSVIEGFRNSSSIKELGDYYKIEMPICNSVFRILYNGTPCNEVLTNLLERDLPDKEIAFYF